MRDTKVEAQAAELTTLNEKMALPGANSGVKILREVEERKSREVNLVFYRIPEVDGAERVEVKKKEDKKRVRLVLQEIDVTSKLHMKFSRRIGEKHEGQEARPLLVGFDSVQTIETILERSHRLSKSTHEGLREFTVVPTQSVASVRVHLSQAWKEEV